jgi:hypothetical protein
MSGRVGAGGATAARLRRATARGPFDWEARSHPERGRYRPELEALTHIVVDRRS